MDYGKIVKESFAIAWRYKTLWIFVLFAEGGATGFNFAEKFIPDDLRGLSVGSWNLPDLTFLIGPLILAFITMLMVFMVLHLVSLPALIDGCNRIKRGGLYFFSTSLSAGLHYFWRFLGLFFIQLFVIFVSIGMVVLLLVGFFKAATALGVLSLLFIIPMFIFFVFIAVTIFSLAERVVVVRDASIPDALEEGYMLLKGNFGKAGMAFVIWIALSIGLGIGAMIIRLIVGAPIAGIAFLSGLGLVPALVLAFLIGLPVSIVVGGFTGAAMTNLYSLFYFELVEPSAPAQAGPAIPPQPAV